ncbi:MAG: PSD1 and planctomycete cytochrome C domain-containing protein [Planctomycetaceae bacterium]
MLQSLLHASARTVFCIAILTAASISGEAQEVSFAQDVQPILAKRCFACHGPAEQQAGVALHVREAAIAMSENDRQPIVPEHPEASELLRRITTADSADRMPPEGPALSHDEIVILTRWIEQGAVYEKHWAFVAPVRRTPPEVRNSERVRNPIDQFVIARLQQAGIEPSREASPEKLIRRVYLDLIGLLPPESEMPRPDGEDWNIAWERIVDTLLASEHFGERWGRHWLSLARYADTFGYERDDVRPNAWRYRDWVIRSFNQNQPYDQFVTEQLAGDLLDTPSRDQQIATGLHRMNIKNNESGINKEDYRNREIVDRVNTTSTALLGLTIGCAQCHSHKYDPISQTEYYQFYAFFNNASELDVEIEGTPAEKARYDQAKAAYDAHAKRLENRRKTIEAMLKHESPQDWLLSLGDSSPTTLLDDFEIDADLKSAIAASGTSPSAPDQVLQFWNSLNAQLDDTRKDMRQLSEEHRHLPKPGLMTLTEATQDRRATHVLVRGDFKQHGDEVAADTPAVLNPLNRRGEVGDRLDLAHWIVSHDNPLTARVAVNQIWQHLFGQGLVATPDDFGTQGQPPSHLELLDWLAVEFMESGWDRKKLMRTILLSATYRQDSVYKKNSVDGPDPAVIDPENRLLWRQARFRVEAEIVRDLFLDAGGLLHRAIGGPTIFPELPSGVSDLGYKYTTHWMLSDKPSRYRRGMYIHFKRTNPYPSLIAFDGPESNLCQAMRNNSNTPLQALTALNDPVFVECAQALGRRLALMTESDEIRIRRAFQVCFNRLPRPYEEQVLLASLRDERESFAKTAGEAIAFVGDYGDNSVPMHEMAAWISVSRTVLNLDEFITRE